MAQTNLLIITEFDEADFGVADPDVHPDEVVLPVQAVRSNHFNGTTRNAQNGQSHQQNQPRQVAPLQPPNNSSSRPQQAIQNNDRQNAPQTPNSGFQRTHSGAERQQMPPPQHQTRSATNNASAAGRPPVVGGRTLNQPSRNVALAPQQPTPQSPGRPTVPKDDDTIDVGLPPQGAGFFSARAAAVALIENANGTEPSAGAPPKLPPDLKAFDPRAESPSIRKTPGVDHRSSKPVGRDGKHVPSSSQASAVQAPSVGGGFSSMRGGLAGIASGRVGGPGSPSPLGGKNYKPPTIIGKRMSEGGERRPLNDLPANGAIAAVAGDGPEVKRVKL